MIHKINNFIHILLAPILVPINIGSLTIFNLVLLKNSKLLLFYGARGFKTSFIHFSFDQPNRYICI